MIMLQLSCNSIFSFIGPVFLSCLCHKTTMFFRQESIVLFQNKQFLLNGNQSKLKLLWPIKECLPKNTNSIKFNEYTLKNTVIEKCKSYTPNFFGFPKDRFAFFLLPNIEQVRVQFFVVVIYLEECAPVRIHQVFCIYLQNNTKDRTVSARAWNNEH